MKRLIMWDIDYTLLRGGGVAARAWKAAFTELTGVAWRATPNFGGRTDLDICAEVFATHGVTTARRSGSSPATSRRCTSRGTSSPSRAR
ncbi:hypothetical protein ACQP2Y_08175 [Actinoplanes sp. CA-051413]|uniref:hypothetical protein n=1 Tax=Actinoplanes sp. CA-051413 TaxID=3239899 RepID=UPI003D97F857